MCKGFKIFGFILSYLLVASVAQSQGTSQQINLSQVDFSTVKVDQLTDAQVKQFLARAKTTGMTMQEMEAQAIARGMQYSEVLKLRERISKFEYSTESPSAPSSGEGRAMPKDLSEKITDDIDEQEDDGSLKVFGYDLFKRNDLTFEPSLSIATPQNYQLGTGDELVIEVWGASQSSIKAKISPEGQIMVPNLGPIRVGGLTIEKASNLIISRLATIYSGIKAATPNTFAQVALGEVRSIKVTIAGDAHMPGTYTLPSFATAFNALYYAGGPGENGSFREISVLRNGKTFQTIDLYDFLLRGETSLNVRLNDEDVVFVGSYKNRVEFSGEVIRPAIYEMKDKETLADLITFAGGLTSFAYSKTLVVNRKTDTQRKLLNVDKDLFPSFQISNGDAINVGQLLERYENRVTINGAVYREGEYALTEGLTLKGLITLADGLREDAFRSRVAIYRTQDNLEVKVIDVNLENVLTGTEDIALHREDLVLVSSVLELKQERTVNVSGEVQKPGNLPYAVNLTLGEVIRKAGGLKDAASLARIEVARRVKNQNATSADDKVTEVFTFPLDQNLSLTDQGASFMLEPFDMVFVRRSPGYQTQLIAKAEGEFMFPGSYAIARKGERISDLIKRAGGLTNEAYLPGATLLRRVAQTQKESIERVKDIEKSGLDVDLDVDDAQKDTHQPIGIDLDKILKNPYTPDDLILSEGDILRVPQRLQTVRLSGALLNPVTTRFVNRTSVRSYISRAGGFADNARKSKVFVIYANGSVDRTRSFLFFRRYPKVEPGAEIIVPTKPEKEGVSLQETLAISSTLSSIALVTITIINQLKPEK